MPNERTSIGFKDGVGQPAVEGSGIPSMRAALAFRRNVAGTR
jgi:hypothetical protein